MKIGQAITWDLSFLYSSVQDDQIESDIERAQTLSDAFVSSYKGKINSAKLTSELLLRAMQDLEQIYVTILKPHIYGTLIFKADTTNSAAKNLRIRVEQEIATIFEKISFFKDSELVNIPDATFEAVCASPLLAHYKYFFENERSWKQYLLSEAEENIIQTKDLSGKNALRLLYDEYLTSLRYPLETDGKLVHHELPAMRAKLNSDNRDLRRKAHESLNGTFNQAALVMSSIYNSLISDHVQECKLRNIENVMLPTLHRDGVSADMIETMISITRQHFTLAQRFYQFKARMLNLDQLELYDRHVSLGKKQTFTVDQARTIILGALADFDGEFYEKAGLMFSQRTIDAEVRSNKQYGAFCFRVFDHVPPIIMSYSDTLEDLYTLAHELGHGVHNLFANEQQTFITFASISRVIAETASNFCEILLTDSLLKQSADEEFKRTVLIHQMDGLVGSIFNQVDFILFEKEIYEKAAQQRLSANEIGEMWRASSAELYGPAVRIGPKPLNGWITMRYFFTHNFLCYAYAFAQLFVVALYQHYLDDKADFIPKYKELLRAGGKYPPGVLADRLGIDLTQPQFWQNGFRYIRTQMDKLETLLLS